MFPSPQKQFRLAIKLFGVFLAAIFLFGCIYYFLTNFDGQGLNSPNGKTGFLDSLYFSVVTIATLGYGDISPIGMSRLIASLEVLFGLMFVGYSISQVLSAKQEALIEYLTNDRLIQTYDECLDFIRDSKELLSDKRREIQSGHIIQEIDFIYNRSNPFYPSLRAIETLNGYTNHIKELDKHKAMADRIQRATHHVEELAGTVRKLINFLDSNKIDWKTERTTQILADLCDGIEEFAKTYTPYTRYQNEKYKGGQYLEVVQSEIYDIRKKLSDVS